MRASSVLVFHQQFALGSDDLVGRNEVAGAAAGGGAVAELCFCARSRPKTRPCTSRLRSALDLVVIVTMGQLLGVARLAVWVALARGRC